MSLNAQPICNRITYMRWRFHAKRRLAKGLVDVAPLVDVTLLVLFFFIMNSAFVLQPSITVDLPRTVFASGAEYGSMVVTISQENLVFFNDERTTLQGLALSFSKARHRDPDATLVIEADERVPHSTLVDIYNMAMQAGIREVAIATQIVGGQDETP